MFAVLRMLRRVAVYVACMLGFRARACMLCAVLMLSFLSRSVVRLFLAFLPPFLSPLSLSPCLSFVRFAFPSLSYGFLPSLSFFLLVLPLFVCTSSCGCFDVILSCPCLAPLPSLFASRSLSFFLSVSLSLFLLLASRLSSDKSSSENA